MAKASADFEPRPQQPAEGGGGGRVEAVASGDRRSRRPASAPTSVMAFQSTKTPIPVAQKPSRPAAVSGWPTPTAVDSSMVRWAAASLRGPRTPSIRETWRP